MNCTRCHSLLEAGDLRCPVCALEPPRATSAEPVTSKVLRCRECHATLQYSVEFEKSVCGFCGAALELEYSTDPMEHAEAHVPFVVSRASAEQALRFWLSRAGAAGPV
jgi:RNA polymerase subunit RPABC4/transcription elongation factor Spt4